MNYILVILLVGVYGKAADHIEFPTQHNCLEARAEVMSAADASGNKYSVLAFCVKK